MAWLPRNFIKSEVGLTQLAKTWFAAWMVKCERLINKLPFCCPFYLYELFRCLSCDPVSDFSSDRVIKILCYLELRSLRSGNAYDFYTCILRSQILELPWGPWERQTCSNYREVWKIRGKITVFNWWGDVRLETSGILNNPGFEKTGLT